MEFFKILGIEPPRLNLDAKDLEKRYYDLSLKYHPDRNRSGACSTDLSAKINEAYKTLKDPWSRAQYVMEQSGVSMDSKVPTNLAEIYFELQEDRDRNALKSFLKDLQERSTKREFELKRIFNEFDSKPEKKSALNSLREIVTEETYACSMQRDLEQRLKS